MDSSSGFFVWGAADAGVVKPPQHAPRGAWEPLQRPLGTQTYRYHTYSLRDVERRPVLCSFKRIEGGSAYQKNSLKKNPLSSLDSATVVSHIFWSIARIKGRG